MFVSFSISDPQALYPYHGLEGTLSKRRSVSCGLTLSGFCSLQSVSMHEMNAAVYSRCTYPYSPTGPPIKPSTD